MKYSDQQLRTMFKDYLTKVIELTQYDLPEDGEIERHIKHCRFSFVEGYSCGGAIPSVDVLFLLGGNIKNYQAFTIEDGKLVELHQEHLAEYCLTCFNKEAAETATSTINNYF